MFNITFDGYYLGNSGREYAACILLVSFVAYSVTLKMEVMLSSKISVTSTRLPVHDVTSKKRFLFIVTAVRTSNSVHLL
jgi:hypothetical protein